MNKTIKMMFPLIAAAFLTGCGGGTNLKDDQDRYIYQPQHSEAWNILQQADITTRDYTKEEYEKKFGINDPDSFLYDTAAATYWTLSMGFVGTASSLIKLNQPKDEKDLTIGLIPKSIAKSTKDAKKYHVNAVNKASAAFLEKHPDLVTNSNDRIKKMFNWIGTLENLTIYVTEYNNHWLVYSRKANSRFWSKDDAKLQGLYYKTLIDNLPKDYYIYNTMGKKKFHTFPYVLNKEKGSMLFIKPKK